MDSTNNYLPPGVWDHPERNDIPLHDEFIEVWYMDEAELRRHWEETAGSEVSLRALAYSCTSKGCDCTNGHYDKYDVVATADDGYWDVNHYTFSTIEVMFGSTYVIAAGEHIPLPPSETDEEAEEVKALGEGWHPKSCFTRHPNVDIPPNTATSETIINYARLKFWAKDDSLTGAQAVICGIESSVSPTNGYAAQTWERTDNRVYWDAGAWTIDTIYYSPNIACVIQEIIDGPSWSSGDDILMFCDGYGTAVNEAYDYIDDSAKSTDLEIWWTTLYRETMSGGVLVDGAAVQTMIHSETMSGGLVANSQATYGLVIEERTARHGEIWLDGSASVVLGIPVGGGVKINSTARMTHTMNMGTSGGVVILPRLFPTGTPFRQRIIVPEGAVGSYLEKFYLGIATTIRYPGLVVGGNFKIYNAAQTQEIACHVRSWDDTTGKLVIFFKADLRADADNVYYLGYGV